MEREELEEAGLREDGRDHHHPGQQEDDVQVDRRERLLLVQDAQDDDEEAADERHGRAVPALGGDEGVRDDEDRRSYPGVHAHGRTDLTRPPGASAEARPGSAPAATHADAPLAIVALLGSVAFTGPP